MNQNIPSYQSFIIDKRASQNYNKENINNLNIIKLPSTDRLNTKEIKLSQQFQQTNIPNKQSINSSIVKQIQFAQQQQTLQQSHINKEWTQQQQENIVYQSESDHHIIQKCMPNYSPKTALIKDDFSEQNINCSQQNLQIVQNNRQKYKEYCLKCDMKQFQLKKQLIKMQDQTACQNNKWKSTIKKQYQQKYNQLWVKITNKQTQIYNLTNQNNKCREQIFHLKKQLQNQTLAYESQTMQKQILFQQQITNEIQKHKQSLQQMNFTHLQETNRLKQQIKNQQKQYQSLQQKQQQLTKKKLKQKQEQLIVDKLEIKQSFKRHFQERQKIVINKLSEQYQQKLKQKLIYERGLNDQIEQLCYLIQNKNKSIAQCMIISHLSQGKNSQTSQQSKQVNIYQTTYEAIQKQQKYYLVREQLYNQFQIKHSLVQQNLRQFYYHKQKRLLNKIKNLQSQNIKLENMLVIKKNENNLSNSSLFKKQLNIPQIQQQQQFKDRKQTLSHQNTHFIPKDVNGSNQNTKDVDIAYEQNTNQRLLQIKQRQLQIKQNELAIYQQTIETLQKQIEQQKTKSHLAIQQYQAKISQYQSTKQINNATPNHINKQDKIQQQLLNQVSIQTQFDQTLYCDSNHNKIDNSMQLQQNISKYESIRLLYLKQIEKLQLQKQTYMNHMNYCQIQRTNLIRKTEEHNFNNLQKLLLQKQKQFNEQTLYNASLSYQRFISIYRLQIQQLSQIIKQLIEVNHKLNRKLKYAQQDFDMLERQLKEYLHFQNLNQLNQSINTF